MRRNVILDTNVLLHDPKAIFSFADTNVIIPIEVIEEIDSFKRDMTELGRNSRTVAQILDKLRKEGKLGDGIPLERGSTLKVICDLRNFPGGGSPAAGARARPRRTASSTWRSSSRRTCRRRRPSSSPRT